MTSRELVKASLRFERPERIPIQCWILPWAEERYPEDVHILRDRYPDDIVFCPGLYRSPLWTTGDRYGVGEYIDEWGCRFTNLHSGAIGAVRKALIQDWDDLNDFQPPPETLDVDLEKINAFCRGTDRYVLSYFPGIRPFERFQFIRTMEQALIDLMIRPPEMDALLKLIHRHYRAEVEAWCRSDVDGIMLMDDWGTQQGLIVDPAIFRTYFKPLYQEYAEIAHARGKTVWLHSDGNITDIIEDLIEVGIDALNSQLFCMNIVELGRRFRGRITFWGEIDRQDILALGSDEEVRRAVDTVYTNLYHRGGIIGQCEFGLGARPENVLAVFQHWNRISQAL